MSPHLLRAYRVSAYRAAGLDLRIGRRNVALDGLLAGMGARQAVLITACNPRSRRMPPGWNARMMARLHAKLSRRTAYPAESGPAASQGHVRAWSWHESQFLAACPEAWAACVARLFRQNALVALRPGRAPRLLALT
jgi:hypothetical protein